jgi:tetratricopeptide (TPR) repeat protein
MILINAGQKYLEYGEIDLAIEILEMSKIVLPENIQVYLKLGDAYKLIGNEAKAIENYKMVLKLDKKNIHAKEVAEVLEKMKPPAF